MISGSHGGELGAGGDGGVERRAGVVDGGVGHVAQGRGGGRVLNGQGALGSVSPFTGDVELLGNLVDDALFLGGGNRAHVTNLLPRRRPL